jgi:PAS domain S-box-containing protein
MSSRFNPNGNQYNSAGDRPWKIILVDDDPHNHKMIKLFLKNFVFEGRPLTLISAFSGDEARSKIQAHPDAALILLDMVMEDVNAGLRVAEFVRTTANNMLTRIVILTGQPNHVTENDVLALYDINDYKLKSDFTRQKLTTTVVASLRSYRDLITIEDNRQELAELSACLTARTAELECLNEQLETEIRRRKQAEEALQQEFKQPDKNSDAGKACILIVDDHPIGLETLNAILKKNDYTVITALDGASAIEAATSNAPDLIILDIMLPDMDGYDVCSRLESDPVTKNIPVFFVSALNAVQDKVRAFAAGGVDYVTKPIQAAEVLVRVSTHLRLRTMQKQLQERNVTLQREIAQRKTAERAKNEMDRKIHRAVMDSPFPIMIHAEDGEILLINQTWTEITGYTREEIPTISHWTEKAYGKRMELVKDDIEKLYGLDTRKREGEYVITTKKGEQRVWEFGSAPLERLSDGRRVVISTAVDVTRRKQAETQLEVALQQEQEQRLQAETLSEVAQSLNSHTRQVDVLEDILRQMQRLVPYNTVHIVLLDRDMMRMAAWHGYESRSETEFMANLEQSLADLPLDAEVVRTGKPLIVNDTHNHPDWVVLPESSWVKSYVALPICHRDQVLGLLRMDADHTNAFTQTAIDRVQPLVQIAAVALDKARLYDQAQREIETRQKAQADLLEQRNLLQAVIDTVPDYIFVKDVDSRFIINNAAHLRALGAEVQSEVLGRTDFDFFAPEFSEAGSCDEKSVIETGQPVIDREEPCVPANSNDLQWLTTTKVPLLDQNGQIIGIVGRSGDITERKQAELALQQANAQKERLLAAIPSILIGVDAENKISLWNGRAEAVFDIERAGVLSLPLVDCGVRWDWIRIKDALQQCRSRGNPLEVHDIRYTQADGKQGFLDITVTPFADDDSLLLLAQDMTARKALEGQLAQAQKLEAVGQLAAGIAHEINTPTQYIGDNIEFVQVSLDRLKTVFDQCQRLLNAGKNNAITADMITELENVSRQMKVSYLLEELPIATQEAMDGVARVTAIVTAMREFSHPGMDEKAAVDINRTIQSAIVVARNEWKYVANLETDFAPDLPLVVCLPGKFSQAILNIIINAAHAIATATDNGQAGKGTIKITTRLIGDNVEITVSDTGTGISKNIASKIFDPFFTTKEVGRGTGQGLAITHSVVVEQHKGTITFESEPGQGTKFAIRLPVNQEQKNKVF